MDCSVTNEYDSMAGCESFSRCVSAGYKTFCTVDSYAPFTMFRPFVPWNVRTRDYFVPGVIFSA